MAAILNTVILNSSLLDSAILHKTLTQTNSIWLKLIHSHSTWRCQPSWILPLGFSHFAQKKLHSFILTQLEDGSHLEFYHLGFSHFAQKKLHSFILTLLDGHSHLEFCHVGLSHCHLGFRHLVIFSQIHSDNTLTPLWLWLKQSQSDSNSFILT